MYAPLFQRSVTHDATLCIPDMVQTPNYIAGPVPQCRKPTLRGRKARPYGDTGLNVMSAFNSLILASIATRYGFPVAFGSAIIFMLVFLASILFVVNHPSYARLVGNAEFACGAA